MLQKLRGTNQKGFTLIELMIVIAIIGILAAIAVPQFLAYRVRSYNSAAKAVVHNLKADQSNLNSELGEYGHTEATAEDLITAPAASAVADSHNTVALRLAATDAIAGARLSKQHSITGRQMAIPIAIGDNIAVHADDAALNPDGYWIVARHFNGDTAYGIDSDVENVLYSVSNPEWAGDPAGGLLATAPASNTVSTDDFWDGLTAGGSVGGGGKPTANWLPAN